MKKIAADSPGALWEATSAGKEGEGEKERKRGKKEGKKELLQFQWWPGDTVGSGQHRAQGPRRSERRATSETAPIWRWDAH